MTMRMPQFNQGIYDKYNFDINKTDKEHTIFLGVTGMGKTVALTQFVEKKFDLCGNKIFDIWDGMRGENAMWLLPSKSKYWSEGRLDKYGRVWKATGHPTNLLFPVNNKIPNRLPSSARPFTIPLTKLDFKDIMAVVGTDISKNEQTLWNVLQDEYIDKNTTAPELSKLISDLPKMKIRSKEGYDIPKISPHGASIIFRAIERLKKHKIITSENCETSINLLDEYKDKNKITSLVLTHCESWLAYWIAQWFIRNIFEELKNNKHKRPTTLVLREMWELTPKEIVMPQQAIIRDAVNQILVQGIRSANLSVAADTQMASQIAVARSQFTKTVIFRTKYSEDIDNIMTEESKSYFSVQDRRAIPILDVGNCFVFTNKGRWKIHAKLPRCRVKRGEESLFDIWEKEYSRGGFSTPWVDIKEQLRKVDEDYNKGVVINKSKINTEKVLEHEKEIKKTFKNKKELLEERDKVIDDHMLEIIRAQAHKDAQEDLEGEDDDESHYDPSINLDISLPTK